MASAPISLQSPSSAVDIQGLLSQTPGGSIYGTTPGGTKILYDRNTMLMMRNSPFSKVVPVRMPSIPGVTLVEDQGEPQEVCAKGADVEDGDDEPMFEME